MSDNVPYAEYRSDMGIYRALYKKKPPKQPKVLSLPEHQITPMWNLLVSCWDHDPSARPDAASVSALVSQFIVRISLRLTRWGPIQLESMSD